MVTFEGEIPPKVEVKIQVPPEKWLEGGEEFSCEFSQSSGGGGGGDGEGEGDNNKDLERKRLTQISQSATFSSMANLADAMEGGEKEEKEGGRRVVPIMGSGRGECTVKVPGGVDETGGLRVRFGKMGAVVVPVFELRKGGEEGGVGTHLVKGKGKVSGVVTMSYKVVLRGVGGGGLVLRWWWRGGDGVE